MFHAPFSFITQKRPLLFLLKLKVTKVKLKCNFLIKENVCKKKATPQYRYHTLTALLYWSRIENTGSPDVSSVLWMRAFKQVKENSETGGRMYLKVFTQILLGKYLLNKT